MTKEKFDYIYCSDLNRTKQTLEGILSHQSPEERNKVTYTEELREVKMDSVEDQPIEVIEKMIDRAIEKGYFDFSINLSEFLQNFDVEIKEEITKYLSMHGYKVDWCSYTITVSFEGD